MVAWEPLWEIGTGAGCTKLGTGLPAEGAVQCLDVMVGGDLVVAVGVDLCRTVAAVRVGAGGYSCHVGTWTK